jgi:hypothetical protein
MSLQKVTYAFIPTAINGCALWLDGTDPAGTGVVPSAGSLSTWTDKSGKSNSPTSSSGTYPTYSPTSKCVTWNGGGAQLTFPASLYPFVVGTAFTVFFVEQRTIGSENFIIRGTTQGTNQNLLIGHGGPSPAIAWRFAFYGNDLDFTGLPTYANGEPATVSCFMYSKPNRAIYHNGAVSASVSDTNASDLASWSGAMIGGNSIWPAYYGNVFEMIIYSTSLTLAQRQQVEGYLAQKYSLTGSLPAGHPGLGQTTYRADYRKTNIMKAVPFYTQFSPRQIAGCSHWFDATDSSTITLSSGSLTQWNDKSGNGRNLTAVAGFANATVSSAFQNKLNVFNFSGNGLYRTSAGNVSYPLDVYIIVALKSLTTHVDVLGMGDTSSDNFNSLTFAESAASRWHNGSSFGARQTISTSNETSLSFLLIQWSIANGNYLLRRNGTELIQASRNYSFNNSATAIFQIGYRHTDNNGVNFSGYIGEIIVFNNQIGTTDRQNVESYLTQKWGLVSSLPGGHLHLTKQAGAITPTALSKFRMLGIPRPQQFLPTLIANIQMWMDGADPAGTGVVPSNGSVLSTWTDKSGKSYSSTGVNSPTVVTNAVNSKSAVSYNGSNYSYSTIAAGVFSTAMIIFFVYKVNGAVTYTTPVTRGVFTNGSPIDQYNNTRFLGGNSYNGYTSAYSHASATSTTLFTQIIQQSPSTSYNEYVNGSTTSSLSVTGFSASDTASFVYIGTRDNKGTTFNGYMCELIVFNQLIGLTAQQKIEGYLAWKWGIQASLPEGHPYKSAAP